ncbi:hypothetical protein NDU88_003259 [Pleurodeles waltl]|uniref:Uncharacterized protein n=1 Tax=Pleurodeles waltl TaxID=8319 RepID=A0AAV7VDN9_PLEWA|nr:hypothetical protein NDU88_003259 [Pleurodeles waltl]
MALVACSSMSQEEQVKAALVLLQQAGRMDLLKEEALAPGRPARRASAGVAAAVMACLPPRAGAACSQVRRGGKGAGGPSSEGAAWVGHGRAGRRNGGGRASRASPGAGCPRATMKQLGSARGGRGSPTAARPPAQRAGAVKGIKRAGRPRALWGSGRGRGVGSLSPG